MNVISRYASLVKFSHTIFAMPFALFSYVWALISTGTPFEWLLLVKILLCMVFARNAAMGFNRWADRDIDAKNPRTASRDIPAGRISTKAALVFVIINCILLVATALWVNITAFALSPIALVVLLGYSYCKRFTNWPHLILGLALGIAPVGAYIAVTGSITLFPIILALTVLTWTGGFDILYALQDAEFDRKNGLHSIPARFSANQSTAISISLHILSAAGVIAIGLLYDLGYLYWIGVILFIVILTMQHILYRPSHINRLGATFGLVNGIASVTYSIFAITSLLTGI